MARCAVGVALAGAETVLWLFAVRVADQRLNE